MTARDDALAQLRLNTAPDQRPVLSDTDLDALLDRVAVADTQGRAPGSDGWEAAYDVNQASARAWRVKAGRVAGDFTFSADGATFNKADLMAHCLEMEHTYAALSHGTMTTLGTGAVDLDLIARTVIP